MIILRMALVSQFCILLILFIIETDSIYFVAGYTKEECSERGGTESGTCASGFGVCCISELLIHYLFFEVISTTLKPFNYFHVICRHNSLW